MISQLASQLSVVIPTWERHNELSSAIQSCLNQDSKPLEVIVVNDGPDPKKRKLIEDFGKPNVRYFEAPKTGTPSVSRNLGIQKAKGTLIGLLDDDDYWTKDKLSKQLSRLEKESSNARIIAGAENFYLKNQTLRRRPSGKEQFSGTISLAIIEGYASVNTSSIIAPRWVFLKFPFNEKIKKLEDLEWMIRAGQSAELIVIPDVVCIRQLPPGEGLSKPGDYPLVREWYNRNKEYLTPPARAKLLSNEVAMRGGYDRSLTALLRILYELNYERQFTSRNVTRVLFWFFLPQDFRKKIRSLLKV